MREDLTILAGWLIDGRGSPARANVLLYIRNGRFELVETRLSPGDSVDRNNRRARFIDFTGCTIIPGLIDCHVHLAFSGTLDGEARAHQLRHPFESALPFMHKHVCRHLAHGVVAVRDGGDTGSYALRFTRNHLALKDNTPFQVRACGQAWHAPGRYGRFLGRPPFPELTLSQDLTQRSPGDHTKIIQSGINSLNHFGRQSPPQFSGEDLAELVRTAKELGQSTMVHANGREAVAMAIEAGVHSVEHGFFMGEENLARLADRRIIWVPTAVTMKALSLALPPASTEAVIARRTLDHQLEQMTAARRLGVRVCPGTDSGSLGVHHGRSFLDELGLFLEAGYSVEEILHTATERAAKLLNLDRSMGVIAPDFPATFVVAPGPPERLPLSLLEQRALYIRGERVSPSLTTEPSPGGSSSRPIAPPM